MDLNLEDRAKEIFEPIFTAEQPEASSARRADEAATKTYRYLRIGMVVVVVALAAAVVLERLDAGCFQESISAYWFTPVRAVFVGALIAIGVSLIVIKGNTPFEDACLNVAGMLAPIVAFVPTTDVGVCWSVPPEAMPLAADGELAPWVLANVDNNVGALLIAGFAAHLVASVIAGIENKDVFAIARVGSKGSRRSLVASVAFLVLGTALLWWWDGFATGSHGIAAVLMFGALAVAAIVNGWQGWRATPRSAYAPWYLFVGVAMIAAGILAQLPRNWDHRIFVLEIIEIGLFVAFWLIQSKERWGEPIRPPAATAA